MTNLPPELDAVADNHPDALSVQTNACLAGILLALAIGCGALALFIPHFADWIGALTFNTKA